MGSLTTTPGTSKLGWYNYTNKQQETFISFNKNTPLIILYGKIITNK